MIYLNKDHDIKDKYEDSDWIKTPLVIFLNNTYDLLIKKEVMKDNHFLLLVGHILDSLHFVSLHLDKFFSLFHQLVAD